MQPIETRVFLRLLDALHMKGRKSAWAFGKGNDHLYSFLERPAFERAGNLYLVDIPYGRILAGPPLQSGAFTHAQRDRSAPCEPDH
jgi:gluconolactonase